MTPAGRVGAPSLRPVVVPLSGLLVAQFVSGLSGTIVATSIPTIMVTLDGPTSHGTWLVAATILGNTATTPIWGKLGDQFSPKLLLQVAIGFFVVGSLASGFAANTSQLIASRAMQGVGLGGLMALIMVVVASLVAPRQRGRVNSWLTSVQTTATIAGPVIGGFIVQAPGFGWQWCFFLGIPFAVISLVVISATLRVVQPPRVGRPRIDWAGAILIGTGVPAVLVCVTALGEGGELGWTTLALGGYGVVALVAAVLVELRAPEPVVPLRLLATRTLVLCIIAAACAGSTLFGGTVFISQYLQFGLGMPPAIAGVMLVPMAFGAIITSVAAARYMGRTGRLRPVLVMGIGMLCGGHALLTVAHLAPIPLVLAGTILVASGLGATTHNLVLAAQNTVQLGKVGAVSASVMFFFTLGGTVGLVAYGAVLTSRVSALQAEGATLAEAYLGGMPWVFALSALVLLPALAAVLGLPRTVLRTSV